MSLWKTFQEDFKGFTKENFRLGSNYNIQRLQNYLQKFGVWIQKQQKYTIAKSPYELLLKEVLTEWTEKKLIKCENKEKFASFWINQLFDSDFGKKTRKSTIRPPPTAIPSALALFTSLSPTSPTGPPPTAISLISGPLTTALVNIPIYFTQLSATELTASIYNTFRAYIQLLRTRSIPRAYMQPIKLISETYIQPSGIKAIPAAYATAGGDTQLLSTGLVHIVQNPTSAICHYIYSMANTLHETKMKAFSTMLKSPALANYFSKINISSIAINSIQVHYLIKKNWIKWIKTQNKIDETTKSV